MFQTALVLLVLGILCLGMTLCDEGLAWWRYCRCRGETAALVVDRVKFTFDMSRGTVLAKCLGEVTVIFLSIILMMMSV